MDTLQSFQQMTGFNIGELKMPDVKIGEVVTRIGQWIEEKEAAKAEVVSPVMPTPPPIAGSPPRIPGSTRFKARVRR